MATKKKATHRDGVRKRLAPRANSLGELKRLVRQACLAYVQERTDPPGWTDDLQTHLEAVTDNPLQVEAMGVTRGLAEALDAAIAFVAADHEPTAEVERLARVVEKVRELRTALGSVHSLPNFTRRQWVVIEFGDTPHAWWWKNTPSSRDLAVLSLLAGSWPERITKSATELTPKEVIATEERAVNRWRDKWNLAWRRRKSTG